MKFFALLTALLMLFQSAEARSLKEEQLYLDALSEQVLLAEGRAASYLSKLQLNPQVGREFQLATKMVDVKKSLIRSFSKSRALESQAVRDNLLQVMKKPIITQNDLTELQRQVNKALDRPTADGAPL